VLEARAQAAGAGGKASIKGEIDALRRQEASARAKHHRDAPRVAEHGEPTKDEYLQLEGRLGAAEARLAADIARGPGAIHRDDQA